MQYKKLWISLGIVFFGSFAVLLFYGTKIYQEKPPIPSEIVTDDGEVIYTEEEIKEGQNIWERMGGQEVGTVWGHGAYVAPDWTADGLHRELVYIIDTWAVEEHGKVYDDLPEKDQLGLKLRLKEEIRTNTYDEDTGEITVSEMRAEAINHVYEYYDRLFGDDPALDDYREDIAITTDTVPKIEDRRKLAAFFFWATWSTSTNRKGDTITYTNNWPGEELIDNEPANSLLIWSFISVIFLIAASRCHGLVLCRLAC